MFTCRRVALQENHAKPGRESACCVCRAHISTQRMCSFPNHRYVFRMSVFFVRLELATQLSRCPSEIALCSSCHAPLCSPITW